MLLELFELLAPGSTLFDPNQLTWIYALAFIFCAFMAYAIGANDVANAFGTSIGSGALSMRSALILAGICEFVGAVALGQGVTSTIRTGIANVNCFTHTPSQLMLLMLCSLMASGSWVLLASKFSLPVSTTHSIVGAIVGGVIASQTSSCVHWGWSNGVGGIAASWVISPILSGVMAVTIYSLALFFVLRTDKPIRNAYWSFPLFTSVTFFIILLMIFVKSPSLKYLSQNVWIGILIAIGGGLLLLILGFLVGIPFIKWWIKREDDRKLRYANQGGKKKEDGLFYTCFPCIYSDQSPPAQVSNDKVLPSTDTVPPSTDTVQPSTNAVPAEIEAAPTEEELLLQHQLSTADRVFSYVQVMTACFNSFAHGSNDVANAVGPFTTVFILYHENIISPTQTPIWVLAFGGAFIVIGLGTYGYKVIKTIGERITHVNCSRGFSAELGATIAVLLASRLGFPVSSTHCLVGAVFFVGLYRRFLKLYTPWPVPDTNTDTVGWRLCLDIALSWVFTLPISGMLCAALYSLLAQYIVSYHAPWPEPYLNCSLNSTIYNQTWITNQSSYYSSTNYPRSWGYYNESECQNYTDY